MRQEHGFAGVKLTIVLIVILVAPSGRADDTSAGPALFLDGGRPLDVTPGQTQPLAGIIVDENDLPVPDASVSILLEQVERQMTRTDSAGRFQLKDLPDGIMAELVIRKPGRATICASVPVWQDAAAAEVRLLLPAEAKLEGTVVEKGTGRPVAGVRLTVTSGKNRPWERREPVLSNAEGAFSLSALSAGRYVLRLAPTGEGPADWVAASIPVALGVGDVVTGLRLEVGKGGLVEIAVTDAGSGKPIGKARVGAVLRAREQPLATAARAGDEPFTAVSDADGVAHMRLLAGTYQVAGASCAGYSPQGPGRTITITDGATEHAVVTFAHNVRGVVRDSQGAPVAGTQVKIVAGGRAEVSSDDQGRFEIVWDSMNQLQRKPVSWLVARHEGRNLAALVEIGKNADWLDVKLAPCTVLTGRIVDLNGRGIDQAWVYVTLNVPDWGDTPLREEHIRADNNGRFEIPALATGGQYAIHAYADAYGSKAVVVEVGAAVSRALDLGAISLAAANLSISGRVVDGQSRPLACATIYGCGLGQPARLTAQTDAEGKFTLAGVCAGPIDLGVDPSGRGNRLWAQVSALRDTVGVEVVAR